MQEGMHTIYSCSHEQNVQALAGHGVLAEGFSVMPSACACIQYACMQGYVVQLNTASPRWLLSQAWFFSSM